MATEVLIILDDGHGMDTPGKRTPYIPELGRAIKENEFNRAVVQLIREKCEGSGWMALETAPEIHDVSLPDRTTRANQVYKDFKKRHPEGMCIFVSIHFNAMLSTFEGSSASGIETYHYPGSTEGEKLARAIHNELKKGTPQVNRGVKMANFHVLRKTYMPAVLVEAGFMDDEREAMLMLDPAFQEEVAAEVFAGVRGYLEARGYIKEPAPEDPGWVQLLKKYTDSPDAWIAFVEEMKDHHTGKWLPHLIDKLGGRS